LTSTPYNPGSTRTCQEPADWPQPADFSNSGAVFSGNFAGPFRERTVAVEDPVLIIEEDAPIPALDGSPVRHEDYGHIFSRLRSG
jgi:hypothetical protein